MATDNLQFAPTGFVSIPIIGASSFFSPFLDSTFIGFGTNKRGAKIEDKTCSLALDLASSLSSVKRSCFCCRRNFYSSNDHRFSSRAASASSTAIRVASFALANAKDDVLLLLEPLRPERPDFLDEDIDVAREPI